jgi:hypothetical protein
MTTLAAMIESGQLIKKLREDRFLKPSDIERLSRSIAKSKQNSDYYISHATLADVEAGSVPSIFKIFSLASCFKIEYEQLLLAFGINTQETKQFTAASAEQTTLEPVDLLETGMPFRLNFDTRTNPRETNLLHGKPEEWGALPSALLKRLQPRRFVYALIGIEDDTLAEIIPPGSLVEVDKEQNKVQEFAWRMLRERPIYLVWHDNGYTCSWCQQDRNELTLLPHPISRKPVMRFKIPREATIIGRVVHAWCSLQTHSSPNKIESVGGLPQ